MTITSLTFEDGGVIPHRYTCDGENVNPPLVFDEIPPETQSLALIVSDPDAVSGNWIHWSMWNIDPETEGIPENSTPKEAVLGMTSFGSRGYGGPCPPNGRHRYIFTLFALDTKLGISPQSTSEQLLDSIQGHSIEEARITGTYERK